MYPRINTNRKIQALFFALEQQNLVGLLPFPHIVYREELLQNFKTVCVTLCIWRNALLRKIEKCIVIPRLCKLRIVHVVLLSKTSIENLDVIDKKNTYFQCIVLPVILNDSGLV